MSPRTLKLLLIRQSKEHGNTEHHIASRPDCHRSGSMNTTPRHFCVDTNSEADSSPRQIMIAKTSTAWPRGTTGRKICSLPCTTTSQSFRKSMSTQHRVHDSTYVRCIWGLLVVDSKPRTPSKSTLNVIPRCTLDLLWILVTNSTKTLMKVADGRVLKMTPSWFLKRREEQADSYPRTTWIYLKAYAEYIWGGWRCVLCHCYHLLTQLMVTSIDCESCYDTCK